MGYGIDSVSQNSITELMEDRNPGFTLPRFMNSQ